MVPFVLSFLAGVCALHALPALPPAGVLPPFAMAACAALGSRYTRPAAAFALGATLAWLQALSMLAERLPPSMHGMDVRVTGMVVSLPDRDARGGRFAFAPDRAAHPALPARLRVAWYLDPPLPAPGTRWSLTLRLRSPRGFVNPAGFDYERWLLVQRIGATAYVRTSPPPRALDGPGAGPLLALRHALDSGIAEAVGTHPRRGVIRGLVIGERGELSSRDWDVLARTGTSHLMAISGLHVGLVAGFVAWCIGGVARAAGVSSGTARMIAAACALIAAGAYAMLAGLAVPTRRAWVMLAVGAWVAFRRRPRSVFDAWACAMLVVLATDPGAVAGAGFWLSFGAVFIIAWCLAGRTGRVSAPVALVRIQSCAGLGLLPLTAWFFQQGALSAPLANLLAIPVFSLMIVPACLSGALLSLCWADGAAAVLGWAAEAAGHAWAGLSRIAAWPWASVFTARPARCLVLAGCAGVLWAAAPRGVPARWAGVVLAAAALSWRPPSPPPDAWRLALLDVGQGLAAVVHTHRGVVVYDTGPSYGPDNDAGSRVLVPYLRAHGVRRIDLLVISHPHDDHQGGVPSVRDAFPVERILAAVPSSSAPGADACVAGQRWRFDGLAFRILHPPRGWQGGVNDVSCVLEIDGPGGRLLMPGDVEWSAELSLARPSAGLRRADVVVVPHHGSASSSIPRFVAQVAPRWALIGAGFGNRWGFPHPDVVDRWQRAGATVFDTARHGALIVDAPPDGVRTPVSQRRVSRAWWRAE